MSVLDEITGADEPPTRKEGGGVLGELAGDDQVGRDAEKQTEDEAEEELGSAALAAFKNNDAKGMYQAIANILANEG